MEHCQDDCDRFKIHVIVRKIWSVDVFGASWTSVQGKKSNGNAGDAQRQFRSDCAARTKGDYDMNGAMKQ